MKLPQVDYEHFQVLINTNDKLSETLKKSLLYELKALEISHTEIRDLKKWLPEQLIKPKISSHFNIQKFKNRPRYLTDAEINDILNDIPKVYAATEEEALKVRDEIKRTFYLQIKNLPIAPSKINDLKKHMINQFIRSRIEPGEAVGLKTGEANGAPMMQLTLNSFHQAGSATANQSGIDTYKELINVTKQRKNPHTTIHFKNKNLTFDDIVNIKNEFIGVTINDLYNDPIRSKEIRESDTPQDWWYEYHKLIFDDLPPDFHSRQYLRLHLDVQKLYNYSITLDQIVTIIEKIKIDTYFIAKCVYSPDNIGIIDIYINKLLSSGNSHIYKDKANVVKAINDYNATVIFLQLIFYKLLDDIYIKGIKGFKNISPGWIATTDMIRGVEAVHDQDRVWRLWLDDIRLKITGITIEKVIDLYKAAGCEILSTDEQHIRKTNQPYSGLILIKMPEQSPYPLKMDDDQDLLSHDIPRSMKPTVYVSKLLAEEDNQLSVQENLEKEKWNMTEGKEGAKYPIPNYQDYPVLFHGKYYYLTAEGLNLRNILAHPEVDSARTISNDFYEVKDVRGLSAAKNLIAREIYELIDNSGSYISPRHIQLLVDVMVVLGLLVPVSSRGVARLNRGAFADASFENVIDAFKKSAVFGKWEEIVNTSACILMGLPIKIGTGSFQLQHDSETLKQIGELTKEIKDTLGLETDNQWQNELEPQTTHARKEVDPNITTVEDIVPEENGMKVVTLPNGRILQILNKAELAKPLITHEFHGTLNCKLPIPEVINSNLPVPAVLLNVVSLTETLELTFKTLDTLPPRQVQVNIPTGINLIPALPDLSGLTLK